MQNMKKFIKVVLLLLKCMGHLKSINHLTLTLFLTFVLLFLPFVLTITIFPIFPHLPNGFCTKDRFTFEKELKEVSMNDKFLVSFDVNSLFTNIPLKETMKLAVDLIKTSYPI